MRRRLTALLALAMMLAMMLAFSAPGFADAVGYPHAGSCGFGEVRSEQLRENPLQPGAGEASGLRPTICPGKD
jgi:hypothetical protein